MGRTTHFAHEQDGVFKEFLKHDVEIDMIEDSSIIDNIENYIDAHDCTIIIIFRLYAYPSYSFWRKV